ncbi:hypothetical protein I2I11_07700 [Pontibacter sp. 172403-2]|uniref:hypothetical protein n=1 Tax=Pontibacter rufus TaxID=2791028 RepID=UPI0018AF76D6|nr:hypothetical protein [Pontibacter sp. 172403-2]MBF9253172.1 hypothetical protein [Pontibacter sp. 172403-2]
MRNLYLLLFLSILSCQQNEQQKGEVDDFNFKVKDIRPSGPLPTGPYLLALHENNKLNNGDWYRAKVFLKNYAFPPEYSDSTVIKFLQDSATIEDILEKGINAIVRNDTGYVKFKAYQPNLGKGDSVLKRWEAVFINPSMPENPIYTVQSEYMIYGR